MRYAFGLILCLTIACHFGDAENLGTIEHQQGKWMKFENGIFISMQVISQDSSTNQVEIFNQQGQLLVSLNVLRLVPDARRVSIYDVSARLGGIIVVGAVYESKQDEPANCNLATRIRPAATLTLGVTLYLRSLCHLREKYAVL
jgi:hypothetical protein